MELKERDVKDTVSLFEYLKHTKDGYENRVQHDMQVEQINKNGVKLYIEVLKHHCNASDMAHGGFLAGVIDTVTCIVTLANGCVGVSINLNVNFVSPARIGEKITACAQIARMGSKICHATATLTR